MEIWHAFEEEFNPYLAEFYTVLFAPILHYHNYYVEKRKERNDTSAEIMCDKNDIVRVLRKLENMLHHDQVVRSDRKVLARMTQLKLLLECYGKYIEDNVILEAYQVILATMREQVGGQNDYCSWVSTGKLID